MNKGLAQWTEHRIIGSSGTVNSAQLIEHPGSGAQTVAPNNLHNDMLWGRITYKRESGGLLKTSSARTLPEAPPWTISFDRLVRCTCLALSLVFDFSGLLRVIYKDDVVNIPAMEELLLV